jgi:uncharacterized protein with HEPN domain
MQSMPSKDPGQRLQDILDNIEAIRRFISGMGFETFVEDQKTFYAATRALEMISGASRRLPEEVKAAHANIDWKAVAAAGNVYRHEYEVVDGAEVWHTATVDLQHLESIVRQELSRLDKPPVPRETRP